MPIVHKQPSELSYFHTSYIFSAAFNIKPVFNFSFCHLWPCNIAIITNMSSNQLVHIVVSHDAICVGFMLSWNIGSTSNPDVSCITFTFTCLYFFVLVICLLFLSIPVRACD